MDEFDGELDTIKLHSCEDLPFTEAKDLTEEPELRDSLPQLIDHGVRLGVEVFCFLLLVLIFHKCNLQRI